MALPHRLRLLALASASLLCGQLAAAQARFDLTGPKIDIRVTRAGVQLPIAAVPNLQPGDQIWLHPDLPPTQSVKYLLIVSFLRGTTNPPPDAWFTRIETWQKNVREEGVTVTVPDEAQQAVLFLAPETGGDFGTLRSAVKGRPGIFVRASQDLTEAGFEQARTDKYLAEMKLVPPGDPKALQEHSDLLARTLSLKPNPDCYKRPLDQQYNCLTQTGTQTLLDDGHAQSIVAALSNGPGSDLINQASYTSVAGAGVYSAYVGAIVDFARLVNGLHTAKYQYIPAIASPRDESLNLSLNTAPSFNNPKSVIVIALPAVAKAVIPPLRPVDPAQVSCLLNPKVVLPIEGAPLVFSTAFAHNLVLHIESPAANGKPPSTEDIPLTPDAFQGGLTIAPTPSTRRELPYPAPAAPDKTPNKSADRKPEPAAPPASEPGSIRTGTIRGQWGFDAFNGPAVALQQTAGTGWHIVNAPDTNLIAGQPNHLQLASSGTACIRTISLEPSDAKVDWKLAAAQPDKKPKVRPVDLTLNLQHAATPGSIHLHILQFGQTSPDELGTRTFSEPAKIEALHFHAGDTSATLTGTSLDQVKTLTFDDLTFTPSCSGPCESNTLTLAEAKDAKAVTLKPNEKIAAQVHLNDGRTLDISTTVLPPRPSVTLLTSRVTAAASSPIQLTGPADLPLGSKLTFFLKSKTPFPRTEQIELANLDESLHATLSVAAGTLILQDAHTVLATFDPLKTFGPSTFGPLRLRALAPDGTAGDWLPLATIVRLPTLSSLDCPVDTSTQCKLTGSDLYLIDSIALDPTAPVSMAVPEGFVDTTLTLPHPAAGSQNATFYLRLRDDPATLHPVTITIAYDSPPPPAKQKAPGTMPSAPPR